MSSSKLSPLWDTVLIFFFSMISHVHVCLCATKLGR